MPTGGKFFTPSSPREHHCFCSFYTIVFKANPTPPFHLFLSPSRRANELDKTIIRSVKHVAPRSSIRGFKDDYYYVNTDVVLLEGEVHVGTKPVSIAPYFRSGTCIHVDANSHLSLPTKGGHALHGRSSTRAIRKYDRPCICTTATNPRSRRNSCSAHAQTERRPSLDGGAHAPRRL